MVTEGLRFNQQKVTANVPSLRRRRAGGEEGRSAQFDLSAAALFAALEHLCCQGSGPQAWVTSLRHDPIAFLLDTMSDAVNVWSAEGHLVYQNPSGAKLGLGKFEDKALVVIVDGEIRYQRRCLRFQSPNAEFLLEVIRPLTE